MFTCIIVDDDRWSLVDIRRNIPFEAEGFQVVGEYLNASDALNAIALSPPDLVVTDIHMGSMSGLDLIDEGRRRNFPSLFVIVSGHSDFIYAQKALNSGVCHFMLKPVVPSEGASMLTKIRNMLQGKGKAEASSDKQIDRIMHYVRQNYHKRISLEGVADHFHLNKTYLSEVFKKETGKSFVQFRNEVRIEQAKIFLLGTDQPISFISQACGFDDAGYFSTVFRNMTNETPQQYRSRRLPTQ